MVTSRPTIRLEVAELLEEVNRLCLTKGQRGVHETPTLTLTKRKVG